MSKKQVILRLEEIYVDDLDLVAESICGNRNRAVKYLIKLWKGSMFGKKS